MAWLRWWAQRATAVIGWPGWGGVVLLVAALFTYLAWVPERVRRLEALRADTATLKQRIEEAARSGIPLRGSEAELGRFYDFFATAPLTAWLDKLYVAADTAQLTLEQGEYRTIADPSGKLVRYQVTLPVKGTYVQIRRFIDLALTEVPVAALDEVRFKRENIATTQMEARVRFTLFLGAR